METYKQTHPWITFQVDLRKIDPQTWLLLGQAQSDCKHISGIPLLPEAAAWLHEIYLAKGVIATTAIEGNTLTEEDVLMRLAGKLDLPPSKEYLGQEIDNVIEACNLIAKNIYSGVPALLSVTDIKEYNKLLLHDLPLNEEVSPGQICTYSVGVGRYRGAPAEECEHLLERLCGWLNRDFDPPDEAQKIVYGLLKAIIAHLYFAWIHPFGDGNGRTARLIEFQILLASGVPFAAAQLLSNHYNQTRSEYYRQLDQASRSEDIMPFIRYAIQGFVDGLQEQLAVIRSQQLYVHWINYIHTQFRNRDKPSDLRNRQTASGIITF